MRARAWVVLSWFLFAVSVSALGDDLCVDGKCASWSASEAITPADHVRSFTLLGANGELTLGVIAANATSIDLDASKLGRVTFRVEPVGDALAGTVTLRSLATGRSWSLPLAASQVSSTRTVRVPAGSYEVTAAADHHRTAWRTRSIPAGQTTALGTILLNPAPVIRGQVYAESHPVSAQLSAVPTGQVVTTDAKGVFTLESGDQWPEELIVNSRGYGKRMIALPGMEADLVLPRIELQRGGTLRVHVNRGYERRPIDVDIGVAREGLEPQWIASKALPANGSEALFTDVEAGVYTVLVRGPEPLARIAGKAVLGVGDTRTITVTIPGGLAHGRVTLGGLPLPNARVVFDRDDWHWQTSAVTEADGSISSIIWDKGFYDVWVRGGAIRSLHPRRALIDGTPISTFSIEIPDRRIRGRIIDQSGSPVTRATVVLHSEGMPGAPTTRAVVDDKGAFDFEGIEPGKHALNVITSGFLNAAPISFEVGEKETAHDETIVVNTGFERRVDVADPHGAPAVTAKILCVTGGVIRSMAFTDVQGSARVATPLDEGGLLFVIPREGSLAIARLGQALDPNSTSALKIIIPFATASLEVAAVTVEGAGLPGLSMLLRYNGEIVPPSVLRELERLQGISLVTNADGRMTLSRIPTGSYELWPYRSAAEVEALMDAASASAAPIHVNVLTGENHATVRFSRRF